MSVTWIELEVIEVLPVEFYGDVEVIDAQDVIDSQYLGLAFLTTESE